MNAEREEARLVGWLRGQTDRAGTGGFVVGLSGGIDSAVVARLCQMASPNRVLGVILPCHSHPDDANDARTVAERFDLPTITVSLDAPYDALTHAAREAVDGRPGAVAAGVATAVDLRADMPLANMKPRLRMATLYYVANRLNYLVAGTGNRCEIAIGYFTKYGDGGSDLLPLGHLLKSEVRALARHLGVPTGVIDKPPSAGLWLGQTDEGEMGFTYADLEAYLEQGAAAVAPAIAARIAGLHAASAHKRQTPPIPPRL